MVSKMLRKAGTVEKLALLLESDGGDLDAAAKIAKLCRAHSRDFTVIVPFYAKSAATLIACWATELVMPMSGELGPVEPVVREPVTNRWVPAHSVSETMELIERTKDPLIKLTMADKLSPFLIGGWKDAEIAARQYLEEALARIQPEDKREQAIHTFSGRFKSHGYPIGRELCKDVGLPVADSDADYEEQVCRLHDLYLDALLPLGEQAVVVQTRRSVHAVIGKESIIIDDIQLAKPEPAKRGVGA